MVQIEVSQLSSECTEWRQVLRGYRDEFHASEKALLETCKILLPKDQLLSVEHFQNQFDIQLKNIHDIKQQIKAHERSINGDEVNNAVFERHERLFSNFLDLEGRLQELRDEFADFVGSTTCA